MSIQNSPFLSLPSELISHIAQLNKPILTALNLRATCTALLAISEFSQYIQADPKPFMFFNYEAFLKGIGRKTAFFSSIEKNETVEEHIELLNEFQAQNGQLISLNLLDQKLKVIPPEISHMTRLRDLCLANNQLKELPVNLSKLTSLAHLQAWKNQITYLPPEIGNFPKLTQLNMSNNQLSYLPTEIGQLGSLMALYLNQNSLVRLPAEIGGLTKLETL